MNAGNDDKKTVVRFSIRLESILPLSTAAMLVKFCSTCDREVVLFNEDNGRSASGTSIMEISALEGYQGARFRVEVEGDDEVAREIAETIANNLQHEGAGSWGS